MEDQILDQNSFEEEEQAPLVFATFNQRLAAAIIDTVIFIPLILVIFQNMVQWKLYPLDLLLNLISAGYKPLMEWYYGATIGKMVFKIKVIREDRGPMDLDQSMLRNVFYILASMVAIYASFSLFHEEGFLEIVDAEEWTAFRQGFKQLELVENLTNTFLLISCLLVVFDANRQALHDKIAKTFVVEN